MWLVAVAKDEKLNYFKFSKYLQKEVGGMCSGDISRFVKAAVLMHAKPETQSPMFSHMKVGGGDNMIKEIKPHFSFNYRKSIVFDEDLSDFDKSEILDMIVSSLVWKVKKADRNMIISTFKSPIVIYHCWKCKGCG